MNGRERGVRRRRPSFNFGVCAKETLDLIW